MAQDGSEYNDPIPIDSLVLNEYYWIARKQDNEKHRDEALKFKGFDQQNNMAEFKGPGGNGWVMVSPAQFDFYKEDPDTHAPSGVRQRSGGKHKKKSSRRKTHKKVNKRSKTRKLRR